MQREDKKFHENGRFFSFFLWIFTRKRAIILYENALSTHLFYNEGGISVPAISMFFGIIVRMQSEKGGKHNKPHIHALYGEYEIVVALDGEILEGSFPGKQLKMLEGWMAIHEDELKANWKMLSEGEGFFKIDPLR